MDTSLAVAIVASGDFRAVMEEVEERGEMVIERGIPSGCRDNAD